MKILIAYDGSPCSEAALDDLQLAGLPDDVQATIISVAEAWLPPSDIDENATGINLDAHTKQLIQKHREKGKAAVAEAETFSRHAARRLRTNFPAWKIQAEATYGSPAWEILKRADELEADLIVVGSHGRSAVGQFFLGSISQKVLTEAKCSVRVARSKTEVDPVPVRIVIGFDASPGAEAAVAAVAARKWRDQSEVKILTVTDSLVPTAIGRFVAPVVNWTEEETRIERRLIEGIAERSLHKLQNAGLKVTLCVEVGIPKQSLVEEAQSWHADCIFVGANAHGRFERFLLGSVSAAVAARAHCSVEVIRPKQV